MAGRVSQNLRQIGMIALPSCAFLPVVVVLLYSLGLLGDSFVLRACFVYLFPALGFATLGKVLGGDRVALALAVVCALGWSSLVAYFLYRVARLLTAED